MDFPEWWDWELLFSDHVKRRLVRRDLTELDVRAMLERANGYEHDPIEWRFRIHARYRRKRWIVIVEPSEVRKMLVVVTVFEDK
jgi:hypothetical protein